MRLKAWAIWGAGLALGVWLAIGSATAAPPLSPDEAAAIARDAYVFAYPLVLNYRTMYKEALDPGSKSASSFGKFLNDAPPSPQQKNTVTPNVDTVSSYAWLDLRTEPWVLTMPPVDQNRFYTTQWDDLWAYVIDSPGSVIDGEQGGNYLITPPGWKGDLPKGIKRAISGETYFVGSMTRIETRGPDDLQNLQKIQQGFALLPLSVYLGTQPPKAMPPVQWPPWVEGNEKTIAFFGYVNFLLSFTVPNPQDKPILERIAQLGIGPGLPWEPDKLDPAIRSAIGNGIVQAYKEGLSASGKLIDADKLFGSRVQIGADYMDRTLGVVNGVFGNVSRQAMFFPLSVAGSDGPADGSKYNYRITFPPGSEPPNKFFWSVTLYNLPGHFLVSNPINRYAIGSHSAQLKRAPNGSVTIFVQRNPPAQAELSAVERKPADDLKLSNWLPAPEGPFFAVLRVYGPGETVIDRSWKPPMLTEDTSGPPPEPKLK